MIYNSEKELDVKKATDRLNWLITNKKVFELKEKRKKRSISQNSYLHLVLSWFGLETGYTLEEVKQQIFKKLVNSDLFYEGEHGESIKVQRWRSSADLNTKEMTLAIDRFRDFSSKEMGIYIPEPKDSILLQEIEIEISKRTSKQYL